MREKEYFFIFVYLLIGRSTRIVYLSNVKKDDNMTKKEKVEEKIRSFGLNAEQSNALWAMAGYTGQLMSEAISLAAPKLNGPKAPELKVKKLEALPLAAP